MKLLFPTHERLCASNRYIVTMSLLFTFALAGINLASATTLVSVVEQMTEANYFEMGKGYQQQGAYEEALENLLKAVEIQPYRADIHYHLGLTYQGMLKYSEAEEAYSRAVKINPLHGNAYAHLGEMQYRLRKYNEAKASLQQAEGKSDKQAYIAYMLGLVLLEHADYKGSIASLKRATELDATYSQKAMYAMGVAYSRQLNKQAANQAFKEAAAINSDSDVGVYASFNLQSLQQQEKSPLEIVLGYGFHYDDNVVLKPGGVNLVTLPSGKSDFKHILSAQAAFLPELDSIIGFRANATYYKSIHHKLSSMDMDGITLSLTPSLKMDVGTLAVTGRMEYYLVGRKRYLGTIGIYPSFSLAFGKQQHGILYGGYESKQFYLKPLVAAENRDAVHALAGYTHYIYAKGSDDYLSLGYAVDGDNARGNNWDYLGHKFYLSTRYPFGHGIGLRFNASYYQQDFGKVHSVIGIKQRDRTFTLESVLTYTLKWGDVLLQYAHVSALSNLQIYRYNRNIVGIGFEYRH